MKKYTLLGHVFELELRAYDFLERYVGRIDTYATTHQISKDILEDIKYNIIEKLYQSETPINETFVMNMAQTIGEPEEIFENKSEGEDAPAPKNLLERRFGKDKPMIWGVCYWIAKSFNIPVSIVRVAFLVLVFVYGTSFWLYPVLALFVPFKDKKSTTGSAGNAFFELIRIILWVGVILFIGGLIIGALVLLITFIGFPLLSNQSIQALVPSYLYPLGVVAILALVVLFIGSLGALIKKSWLSKTFSLLAIVLLIGSVIAIGLAGYSQVMKHNYTPHTLEKQQIQQFTPTEGTGTITINLLSDQITVDAGRRGYSIPARMFLRVTDRVGLFQEIKLLPSTTNEVSVEIVDSMNIINEGEKQHILSQRSQVVATISGDTIDITIPQNIFAQKVPFVFAERTVNIYVPTNKTIVYNNQSSLRYSTPSNWLENTTGGVAQTMRYCVDKLSFKFYPEFGEWRCANTTVSAVNQYDRYDDDYYDMNGGYGDGYYDRNDDLSEGIQEIKDMRDVLVGDVDMTSLTPDQVDLIEAMYEGLTLSQAQKLANTKGQTLRVVEENGRKLPVDADYRPGRLNVEVRNNRIVDVNIE